MTRSPDEPSPAPALRRLTAGAARIGVDVLPVRRVVDQLTRHGDRWCRDTFTTRELDRLGTRARDPAALAGRVAAKEAVIKVLAPQDLLWWWEIEVLRHASGAPVVRLGERAAGWAGRRGLRRVEVSISHDAGWAAAVAVGVGDHVTGMIDRGGECGAAAGMDT